MYIVEASNLKHDRNGRKKRLEDKTESIGHDDDVGAGGRDKPRIGESPGETNTT